MIRPSRLQAGLDELGASTLVVLARSSRDPDLAGWVGPIHLGDCFLLLPRDGKPRLGYLTAMERDEAAASGLDLLEPDALEVPRLLKDATSEEQVLAGVLERALRLAGVAPGPIALAGSGRAGVLVALSAALSRVGYPLLPGNRLALLLRKAKTAAELAAARLAAAGAATAMRRVAEQLAAAEPRGGELWLSGAALTVGRLKAEIARTLASFELEQPEGNIVAPAEEGAVPHSAGTPERVVRVGESLVVDLFPRGWLFADVTRTFCVGPPPEYLARAWEICRQVLERTTSRLDPAWIAEGPRAFSLHQSACGVFEQHGYKTVLSHPGTTEGYVHGLGHGVGFDLHEHPVFRRKESAEGRLEVGDLITLEPGLYEPEGGWGVRLEDLLYLGPEGVENLTPLPYDLDPRAW